MLAIGSRSALFEYRVNETTGKVISKGAGPGGSALTVAQSRSQLSMWTALKSPLLVSADLIEVATWATDPGAPTKGSGPELIEVLQNTEVLAVADDPKGKEAVAELNFLLPVVELPPKELREIDKKLTSATERASMIL